MGLAVAGFSPHIQRMNDQEPRFKDVSPPRKERTPDETVAQDSGPTDTASADSEAPRPVQPTEKEIGGPDGPEPTRFGDWSFKGRVTDF
ncbi:MAG: DUF1674 domain-containing protein [Alphaproteobacteria bacterium]|nr:DUF1674 domain-containing protein [Alphaproteobacteria bacterium]